MRKYTAPIVSIRVFNNTAQTTAMVSNTTQESYVGALQGLDSGNKAQVQMGKMEAITKYTF